MAKGSPRDYVEGGSEEVDELYWEGGHWEDEDWDSGGDSGGGGGDGGDGGVEDGGEYGAGATRGASPAEHWRDELKTTGQRIQYVNNVLGLQRGDAGYSNALRYLGLIAEGKREPTSERWTNVRNAAEINYELRHRDIPPPPSRGPSRGPGNFKRGDFLGGSMSWRMLGENGRREVSGAVTLEGESLRLANDGQLKEAFLQGYFDGQMS
jgi:hypothetical protein